jgi:uncharacterized damage-inducible protein DinB
MAFVLTVDDLLEYTTWQRARWRAWFRDHPAALALSAGPHGDGRFASVGDLVKHVFSAEQRYVQRLNGQSLTDLAAIASDDIDAVFAAGETGRRTLVELLRDFHPDQWDSPREFVILGYDVTATPKKIVVHVLLHEVRHWAQIATLCRLNGLVAEFHDFLGSPVWGGTFGHAPSR